MLIIIQCILLFIIIIGCEGEKITGSEMAADAWELFGHGEIDDAKDMFQKAIDKDSDLADAYNGIGWCWLKQNDLPRAKESFDSAISKNPNLVDSFVGRAAVKRDLPDFNGAIQDARIALELDEEYSFDHDHEIDYRDVRIILAQSYFALNDYSYAQEQVNLLDPENGLDPNNPNSWRVSRDVYSTYQEALLITIESLEAEFGTP